MIIAGLAESVRVTSFQLNPAQKELIKEITKTLPPTSVSENDLLTQNGIAGANTRFNLNSSSSNLSVGAEKLISTAQTSITFLDFLKSQLSDMKKLSDRIVEEDISGDLLNSLSRDFSQTKQLLSDTLKEASFQGTSLFKESQSITTIIDKSGIVETLSLKKLDLEELELEEASISSQENAEEASSSISSADQTVDQRITEMNAEISKFEMILSNIGKGIFMFPQEDNSTTRLNENRAAVQNIGKNILSDINTSGATQRTSSIDLVLSLVRD